MRRTSVNAGPHIITYGQRSRKGIVTLGLVSSTFFLVIRSAALGLAWKWLTSTGSAVSESTFECGYYQAAALATKLGRCRFSHLWFALFLGFYISVFVMLYLTFSETKKRNRWSHEDSIESIKHKISAREETPKIFYYVFYPNCWHPRCTGWFYPSSIQAPTSGSIRRSLTA